MVDSVGSAAEGKCIYLIGGFKSSILVCLRSLMKGGGTALRKAMAKNAPDDLSHVSGAAQEFWGKLQTP